MARVTRFRADELGSGPKPPRNEFLQARRDTQIYYVFERTNIHFFGLGKGTPFVWPTSGGAWAQGPQDHLEQYLLFFDSMNGYSGEKVSPEYTPSVP